MDRFSQIQALLLMTSWYETPDDKKDAWVCLKKMSPPTDSGLIHFPIALDGYRYFHILHCWDAPESDLREHGHESATTVETHLVVRNYQGPGACNGPSPPNEDQGPGL